MTRPAPLTPPDCDLRGMPYMELDIVRLLDSDFFAMSTGDEFKAGVALWGKSWNQVPAASLPTDDRILAHLAGVGRKDWPKVKEMALHGWVGCSDGRLYHPTVAEKALKAWGERQAYREDKSSEAERKAKERQDRADMFAALRDAGLTLPHDTKTKELRAFVAGKGLTVTWTSRPTDPADTRDASHGERDQSRDMSQPVRDLSADVTPKRGRGNGNGTIEEDIGTSSLSVEPALPSDGPAGRDLVLVSPEPAPTRKARAKARPTAAEQKLFDEFWSIYPRRVAKQPALEAYLVVTRRGVDPEAILHGLRAYASSRLGKDPEKTAHAASWLNAGRWTDEIEAPPPGGYNDNRPGGGWDPMQQAIDGMDFNRDDAA